MMTAVECKVPVCDFRYTAPSNFYIFTPITQAARDFAKDYPILTECARHGSGYVVERGVYADVIDAIDNAGLYFAPY